MSSKKLAKLEGTDAEPKTVTDDLDFNAVQQVLKTKQSYSSPCQDRRPSFWRHQSGQYYSVGQRAVQKPTASLQTPLDISATETSTACFCGEPMTSCGKSCGRHRSYTRKLTKERNGRRRRANGRSRLVLDFGSLTWRDPKTF